ncbi:MAG: type I-U CRISPR-associated helicase/endonuclease Cas3 [Gammaproteobacteria bacterium]|nr:type I-U CRISPR-associated helicase/endonuclease Cas3 [Gammaproteobacteria bacterium]
MDSDFVSKFQELTGFAPFKWQERLYKDYFAKGKLPSALDMPTGLGKTSVMFIWYLAFKTGADIPRRLIYVVDRRAVVDQATTVADEIREKSNDPQLCVSTLRGQHVDNREWLADPAALAIIVGTVDMIGSRLLFSGYGVSRKMRPYHAGLLGADSLVVLDEAHLVPPFEKLLQTITNGVETYGPCEQNDRWLVPSVKLLSLSATGRVDASVQNNIFKLLPEDMNDEAVRKRLGASKGITYQEVDAHEELMKQISNRAWAFGGKPARVLVYCNSREDAIQVKKNIDNQIKKNTSSGVTELLVGGRRVLEREKLSDWLKDHGFSGNSANPPKQPTFLVATSAGEVGVDLDADHLICDLVEWERMVQRFGRVNRRGEKNASIKIIAGPSKKGKIRENWGQRLTRLRYPLNYLVNGSPSEILNLKKRAANDPELQEGINNATTSVPLRPALTRALVDAWSMTSLDKHTGRPDDIQPWLRGWEEDQRPQTTVLWREHLPVRTTGTTTTKEIEAFFEAAPPHASEKLETESYRVVNWLEKRTKKVVKSTPPDNANSQETALGPEDVIGFILSPAMDLRDAVCGRDLIETGEALKKIKENLQKNLMGSMLIVNNRLGGLQEGMLDDSADATPCVIDDGQEWLPSQNDHPVVRFRVRSLSAGEKAHTEDKNWRERLRFDVERTQEGDGTRWLLVEKWCHDSETEDDRSVGRLQELAEHHAWTKEKARTLAQKLGLSGDFSDMLAAAARLHDQGKRHPRWQRAANAPDGKVYAKTKRMNPKLLDGYRHEFGSLSYVEKDENFKALSPDLQELTLHLIAAHHGWARPLISTNGCDEPPSVSGKRACDVALRFARLQKRWGPWGLAWWEALLRAADQLASRDNDKHGKLTEINI